MLYGRWRDYSPSPAPFVAKCLWKIVMVCSRKGFPAYLFLVCICISVFSYFCICSPSCCCSSLENCVGSRKGFTAYCQTSFATVSASTLSHASGTLSTAHMEFQLASRCFKFFFHKICCFWKKSYPSTKSLRFRTQESKKEEDLSFKVYNFDFVSLIPGQSQLW